MSLVLRERFSHFISYFSDIHCYALFAIAKVTLMDTEYGVCVRHAQSWEPWSKRDMFWSPFPFSSVQFSSVGQSCPTLCDPMNCSTSGLPFHYQLLEFTQTHVHWVSDAIQPSHPLSSPSPPAPNPSQQQSLFQWVNSSYEVAKVLEFQL